MCTTEAWVLPRRRSDEALDEPGTLIRKEITIAGIEPDEALIEPIYGSWESNMSHAIQRHPIDVCRQRGEEEAVLGNAGVVRVVRIGVDVTNVAVGDVCLFFGTGQYDCFGYMELAHAYDAPGTIGLLSKRTKVSSRNLFILPTESRYSLAQWAAFSVRYLTAWSNWHVAYGCLRLQLNRDELPSPYVWGWGGGTTLAELGLAYRAGCKAVLNTSSDLHRTEAEAQGIDTVDRKEFPNLDFKEELFKNDPTYRRSYRESERRFLLQVKNRTGGNGVSIFIDYIGTPVIRATLRALGRQGVVTSAGWLHGMEISLTRAVECIKRHTHVHTHYARPSDVQAAMDYAEANGWMPNVTRIYGWSDIPKLALDHSNNSVGSYFPVFEVNPPAQLKL